MPVTIDEMTAEVDSGQRQPETAEGSERQAQDAPSFEDKLRLAGERAQRVRAD
jgi:hypothetical protein